MYWRVIYVFPRKPNNRRMIARVVPLESSALEGASPASGRTSM